MRPVIGRLVFGTVGGALLFAGLSAHRLPQWFVEQDKLEHISGFFCFAFSLRLAAKRIRWPAALGLCSALAIAIEVAQFWIPGRTASLADALAGVLGAALGWRCAALARAAVTPVEPPDYDVTGPQWPWSIGTGGGVLDSVVGRIAVVGLGYVGLPLALAFGREYSTLGYDIDVKRMTSLRAGEDPNGDTPDEELASGVRLRFTSDAAELATCNVFIVTVPTPVDEHKRPDFRPLIDASRTIGGVLKKGDTVIYESTVYPGATEEICVPELERASGLVFNQDFFVGYSPERINPGDKTRKLVDIPKVTSGSTPETAEFVDALYRSIIKAGTHKASSIRVAEASKVIENTQRDANIALVNEFALIFQRLGIDTTEVLEAAGTKWNFLPFRPGLVGGHCIGVDPYYLIQKAQAAGYYPDILLACRRINDAMGEHVATDVVKLMIQRDIAVAGSRILILGLTFKENCADLRNTRVVELTQKFGEYRAKVDIHDPWADPDEARAAYGIDLVSQPEHGNYDAVVLAVAHDEFRALGAAGARAFGKPHALLYDIKSLYPREAVDARL